ncbi:MAG: thioredoxin domain-containing protein, partial [Chloroflexota bacterium]
MTPVLERIASEHDSGFILAKVNARANPQAVIKNSVRGTPTVKIYRNGKVVEGFVGGRLEAQVRNIVSGVIDRDPPAPLVKVSSDPRQRLGQAKSHLKKGRGFEAAVSLKDFPDGNLKADADKLLPVAQFIWDLDDGDRGSGKSKIDELYDQALDAFDRKTPADAIEPLEKAQKLLSKNSQVEVGR